MAVLLSIIVLSIKKVYVNALTITHVPHRDSILI